MFVSGRRLRLVMTLLSRHKFLHKETKYLSNQFIGRLATSRNNKPHVVPVRYAFQYGKIYINTAKNSRKVRNILENNNVAFVVDDYCDDGRIKRARGVFIEGEAEIYESGNIYEFGTQLIMKKYTSEKGFRSGSQKNRVIIVIKAKKVSSWGL
jgi:nitroimidazol reductase NimA-like FMN-containing flavoprotein (pyridoxamine 5'-phosphate oxidase superfamily)